MKQLLVMLMALVVLLAACEGGAQTETPRESTPAESSPVSSAVPAPGSNVPEMVVESRESSVSNDLRALLAAGQSAKCTFTTENGQVTMYMDGIRQRSEIVAQGVNAYTISDGTWLYSWSGSQGVKYELATMKQMAEDLAEKYPSSAQQSPQTAEDYADDAANVQCSAWSPSGDSFTPPSNIEFQDMAALLQQMQQYQSQMPDY